MKKKPFIAFALAGGLAVMTSACGQEANVVASGSQAKQPAATAQPDQGRATAQPEPVTPQAQFAEPTPMELTKLITIKDFKDGGKPSVDIKKKPLKVEGTGIEIIEEGSGKVVKASDTVTIHYLGVNGTTGEVFDGSFDKGTPVSFPLNRVIKGFAKAINGQKVGTKLVTAISPEDGYGANGMPAAKITGEDTLIFLISIQDPDV